MIKEAIESNVRTVNLQQFHQRQKVKTSGSWTVGSWWLPTVGPLSSAKCGAYFSSTERPHKMGLLGQGRTLYQILVKGMAGSKVPYCIFGVYLGYCI